VAFLCATYIRSAGFLSGVIMPGATPLPVGKAADTF
jgi:hypothetical protein